MAEVIEFITNIIALGVSLTADHWQQIAAVVTGGVGISVVQFMLNRFMSSKKVIHVSLGLLATLVSVGDVALLYGTEITGLLPANVALYFTAALTFYRFGGKKTFMWLTGLLEDFRTVRQLRKPSPELEVATTQTVERAPEFAM